MDLKVLGLTSAFEQAFAAARAEFPAYDCAIGRVTKIERGFAAVVGAEAEGLLHVPKALSKHPRHQSLSCGPGYAPVWCVVCVCE